MKYVLLTLSFLYISYCAFAQTEKKVVIGSFVFDKKVFQYELKRDLGIHTLKIATLDANTLMGLDSGKLSRTQQFIKSLSDDQITESVAQAKRDSIHPETIAAMKDLPELLDELVNIRNSHTRWAKHKGSIDGLLSILPDLNLEGLEVDGKTVKDIYKLTDILNYYKLFLHTNLDPRSTAEVPFAELDLEEFRSIFADQMSLLFMVTNKSDFEIQRSKIDRKADEIFYEIKARLDFIDDEPKTAYLLLKRKFIEIGFTVPVKQSNASSLGQKDKCETFKHVDKQIVIVPFEVKNVIVEFEDGSIKNIFADLQPLLQEYQAIYGTSSIRFRNLKPISIAGKFDPDHFRDHTIYAGNTLELISLLYQESVRQYPAVEFEKEDFKSKCFQSKGGFVLSNLLDYRVISETDNEDYSPGNSKVELSEPHSMIELKKEKRSRILTARAYTDFVGLSDDQPNGLVQIEVSKKVNLISGRNQGLWYTGILGQNTSGIYTGGLAFIEPKFTFSKIEENNRYLILDSAMLDKDRSFADSSGHFKVNPLEVLRFSQWSFGIDLNLLKFNHHNRKSNFQVNALLHFGRTSAIDSLKIEQNQIKQIQSSNIHRISTTTYGLSLLYEVKPDSRFGFSFGYDFRWQDVVSRQFTYGDEFSNRYHVAWFNGFLKAGDDSRIFWRFRKNWLSKNSRYNFYQLQLGYELEIFKANK